MAAIRFRFKGNTYIVCCYSMSALNRSEHRYACHMVDLNDNSVFAGFDNRRFEGELLEWERNVSAI